MKKILALILLVFATASNSHGVIAYDLRWVQRNSTNTSNINIDVSLPASSQHGVLCADGSTHLPVYRLLGSGIVMSSSHLSVDYTTIDIGGGDNLDDWMGGVDADIVAIQTDVAGKANASHSHSQADVSGLISDLAGKETAGAAATAQAYAIQRANHTGTQSSSTITGLSAVATSGSYGDLSGTPSISTVGLTGAYNDLTGKPSTFTPSSHTHPASEISDSTTTGRAVLTAVDAIAARTAIGAGTGGGSVTSVTAGTGLSGGTITGTGTISLPNTGTAGTYSGITTDAQGRITAGTNRSYNHAPGRSIVSVAAAANGFQVSATKDSRVRYSVTVSCAVQIGVVTNVEGYVVLEICPTNSATPGDWMEISRVTNAQNIGLALALSSTAKNGAPLLGDVPAGYYVRIRSVNVAGTPTYVTNGQQEVQL